MYEYAIGVSAFGAAWLVFFVLLPAFRVRLLLASLMWGHVGPMCQTLYTVDYWRPSFILEIPVGNAIVGVEDYLFAYFFAGIATGLFYLFRATPLKPAPASLPARSWPVLLGAGPLFFLPVAAPTFLFGTNSVQAHIVVCGIAAALLVARNKEWRRACLITMAAAAAGFWLFYVVFYLRFFPDIFARWWNLEALSGFYLGPVPIEEMLWAAATAALVGPATAWVFEGRLFSIFGCNNGLRANSRTVFRAALACRDFPKK
ncbi:MAG TPA: lycopene cyclase domain-containing protein [Verrucomicrobiales bacterium]|nr:lycopene cyclase domain-containing protein [Verrucomicrobiales bacterium]